MNATPTNEIDERMERRIGNAYRAAILIWVVVITTAVLSNVERYAPEALGSPAIDQYASAPLVGTPPAETPQKPAQGNVLDLAY